MNQYVLLELNFKGGGSGGWSNNTNVQVLVVENMRNLIRIC